MNAKHILTIAALLAGIGVALGAFGSHGLEQLLVSLQHEATLTERMGWFETGVRYQMYHALALAAVAAAAWARPEIRFRGVVVCFVVGTLLFSGSLYVMTLASDAARKLGAVTPLGGLALLVGWALLAIAAWRDPAPR